MKIKSITKALKSPITIGAIIGAVLGIIIELGTQGMFQFFGLVPKIELVLSEPFKSIIGTGTFPGEVIILTILIYASVGALIGLIITKLK